MTIRKARYADERYAVQRRAGFPWLRFQPDLELEYLDSYIPLNATRLRLAHSIGIAAALAFVAIDVLLGSHVLPLAAQGIVIGITIPALVAPIVATFHGEHGARMQRYVFFSGLVLGLSVAAVVWISRANNAWFPHGALLLVVMYVYLVAGLLLFQAVTVGMTVLAVFLLGELWQGGARPSLIYEVYYLFIANVIGALGLYALQHESRRAFLMHNELRQQAMLDSLTGVMNRREFRSHFDSAWALAQRERKALGLILVDIDGFKAINDSCGHLVGDAALQHVARVLCDSTLRPLDAVGRYGGDEFIALWYGVDSNWFEQFVRELPARLAQLPLPETKTCTKFSVSGGAVLAWPRKGLVIQDAVKLADLKLYEMKRAHSGSIAYAALPAPSP